MLSYHLFLWSCLILYYLIFSSLIFSRTTDLQASIQTVQRSEDQIIDIGIMSNQYAQGTLIWVRVPQKTRGRTTRGALIVVCFGATLWKSMWKSPTWYITYLFFFTGLWIRSTFDTLQPMLRKSYRGTVMRIFFLRLRSIVNSKFATTCHECFLILPSLALTKCWWFSIPNDHRLDVQNPLNNGINYLWTGAGFLPSAAAPDNGWLGCDHFLLGPGLFSGASC